MLKAAGGTSPLSRTCAAIRRSIRARRTPAPAKRSNSYAKTIYEHTFFCSRSTIPSSALSLQSTQDLQNCPEPIPSSNCVGMFMSTARVCFLVQHGYPFVSLVLYPRKHFLIGEKTPQIRTPSLGLMDSDRGPNARERALSFHFFPPPTL